MDSVVYESNDRTFLFIIEQALADNGIPCTVIGGADIGMMSFRLVRICVPNQYLTEARDIVRQIVN
jgi:hypothetical protein